MCARLFWPLLLPLPSFPRDSLAQSRYRCLYAPALTPRTRTRAACLSFVYLTCPFCMCRWTHASHTSLVLGMQLAPKPDRAPLSAPVRRDIAATGSCARRLITAQPSLHRVIRMPLVRWFVFSFDFHPALLLMFSPLARRPRTHTHSCAHVFSFLS